MSIRQSRHSSRVGEGRTSTSTIEAAARAKRARDHLARKRRQDRNRLERSRARAEGIGDRARILVAITPILFIVSIVLGMSIASPVAEFLLLRDTRLERVAIQGAHALAPAAIARDAGVVAGTSLHTIDPNSIRDAVLADPWIESARTLRLPTGTLVISVVERRAVARWRADASEDVELVDRRGRRFLGDLAIGGPLPLVRGALGPRDELPEAVIEILGEINRYASLMEDSAGLTLHLPARATDPGGSVPDRHSGYVLQIGEQGPRALLGDRLLSQRVARLAALLEAEESTFKAANWIDLRYADRAVLQTEPVSG